MEMLEELADENRRVLAFSQFTSMLDLIRPELERRGVAFSLLTGETRDRPKEIQNFQEGRTRIFSGQPEGRRRRPQPHRRRQGHSL
jgi:SNF2 family DNA or RNA helicase